MNARVVPAAVDDEPTTTYLNVLELVCTSVMPAAELDEPPRVPRSCRPDVPVEKACQAPLAVCERPTVFSPKYVACASLEWPPSVPRSTRVRRLAPLNACTSPEVVVP